MASVGQYEGIGLLEMIFGPAIACVRTAIAAAATAQTAINIGSVATGGVSGNADTTPPSNSLLLIAHPSGTGASQNLYSIVQAFAVTSSTATVITIPSQSFGQGVSVGDFVFLLGVNTSTTVTTPPSVPIWLNTLYIGLSTQTWSTTVTDAQLLAGEPTSAGTYGRIACLNSSTNWPQGATAAEVETVQNGVAQTFATSTAAYSTTTTALASWFCTDLVTLAAGHVIWSGALTPATDICNGTGVTFSFATNALKATIA